MKKLSFVFILVAVVAAAMILGACGDSTDNSSSADLSSAENASIASGSDNSNNSDGGSVSDIPEASDTDISSGVNSDSSDFSDVSDVSNESDVSDESDTSSDDTSDESSAEDSSNEENSEPEILGSGTKDDPYLAIPDDDMHVVTVKIPAGKDVYYSIYRVGGMRLKIKSNDAYVIYNGKTYNPKSGSVSLSVEDAMASEAIVFQIGNSSATEKSFELVFSNPSGTYMNPTKIDDITEEQFVELNEGDSVGHYYKYVAEKNGTLKFAMSATADSMMAVTNNRNSAQRTTESDGTEDGDIKYVEIEVQKGDEIIINVGALPNRRGKYPATDITWSFLYK